MPGDLAGILTSTGHAQVFFGCRPWEPRFDQTAREQDSETGLYTKFASVKGRRKRCKLCGGRIRKIMGTAGYCDGCTLHGRELSIPGAEGPPPKKAKALAPLAQRLHGKKAKGG